MVERSVCPHCSFRNFSVSKSCARCEKPLGPPSEAKQEPAFAPASVPPSQTPPAVRNARARADLLSRRTTAPLTRPPPAAPVRGAARPAPASAHRAPVQPGARARPVSMAEGPKVASIPDSAHREPAPAVDEAEAATRIGIPVQAFASAPHVAAPPDPPPAPSATPPSKRRRTSKPLVPARLWQHALAAAIDVLAIGAVGLLWGSFEMMVKGGGWPIGPATFLESLAMWLHIYARTAKRMSALMVLFSLGHSIYGVRTGKTVGRLACGLLLVGMGSGKPTKGGTWSATLWHATGGLLSLFTLGAGHFWMIIDSQQRTWANLLGRTLVVQNAKRQGASRP